jgi:hypothetical protein
MSSDLLDHILIEMAGITQEVVRDLVDVLNAAVDVSVAEATLSELQPPLLSLIVKMLNPRVML